jgi:hypothetical protein
MLVNNVFLIKFVCYLINFSIFLLLFNVFFFICFFLLPGLFRPKAASWRVVVIFFFSSYFLF